MEKKTAAITIRMTESEKRKLEDFAARFELPVGFIVRRLLHEIETKQGNHRMTLCAKA